MKKYSTSSIVPSRLGSVLPISFVILLVTVSLILAGMALYHRGQSIMQEQLKDKLRSTAAAASLQFDAAALVRIRDGDTIDTSEELKRAAHQLQKIKELVTQVRFAYIMKKTDDPNVLTFIGDADMTLTDEELDTNEDGQVDETEEASVTGEEYDITDFPKMKEEAFLHPTTDDTVNEDRWGTIISGYAPIRDENGQAVAILGIDMSADEFLTLSRSIFSPVALLLALVAFCCIGGGSILFLWKRRMEIMERLEIERSGLLRLAFHQLGGPLTIISWSIEELEEEGPASIQRTIANIQEGVKRLTGILKTLKDADMVHTGKLEYRTEVLLLSSILQRVVKESGAKLAVRRQTVNLDLDETVTITIDPKLLGGVAQELLTNAIDFSPDGGKITMKCRKAGRFAEFTITDHGCGIPKKDLPRLFGEFTRGSNATKYKADGNGLGLYIVKGVVEGSGGTVTIDSIEGKGTTVTVRLPMK